MSLSSQLHFVFRRLWSASLVFPLLVFPLLLVLNACGSGDNNTQDKVVNWVSENSRPASMSFSVIVGGGATETITVNGELVIALQFDEDGALLVNFEFTTSDFPCDVENPCSIRGRSRYDYSYLVLNPAVFTGGVVARYVRFTNLDTASVFDGYVYINNGRLCLSHGVWDLLRLSIADGRDPLNIDFSNCFVEETEQVVE